MSMALPDVNVLVALAWPNHVHHGAVRRWFRKHGRSGWATCAITELGFVRVSMNSWIVGEAVSALEAEAILEQFRAIGEHEYWRELPRLSELRAGLLPHLVGHRQVTDAFLLQLAADRGGRLATLDRRLRELAALAGYAAEIVELIEP